MATNLNTLYNNPAKLTQQQELNTAYNRVQAGTPGAATPTNAGDVANLAYAQKTGLWSPPQESSKVDYYAKYRDPATGKVMTPEEYSVFLGNKVPTIKNIGEIPKYAGDAMTNPDATSAELQASANTMNNARNDMAVGATDPYKVGNKSGIAYSPTELAAIEKAYSGVYDPALNDVFARLKEKKDADEAKARREEQIFATNEAIRQWKATTGTKGSGSDASEKKLFTRSQLNAGASNAGLSIEAFDSLDDDIKNFYINTPMALDDENKKVPIYQTFKSDFDKVINGEMTPDELSNDITSSSLPSAVKHYFIDQIPAAPEKKEGWLSKAWDTVTFWD